MTKKILTTLSHTEQVKVTLTSDQLKHLENLCKKRFNMINRSHMIRQLILDSIKKENTIKEINKDNNNENYLIIILLHFYSGHKILNNIQYLIQ